jgi:hypothetical protein
MRPPALLILWATLTPACVPPSPPDAATAATSTTAADSTIGDAASGAPTTTDATSAIPTTTDATSTPGSTFILDTDDPCRSSLCTVVCDVFSQDCPTGDKCAAFANDGNGSWNDTICVSVVPDPAQVGEPCTVEGSPTSGRDDCDFGAMCWGIDEQNHGTCIPLCTGSPEAPICDDPAKTCLIGNAGVLNLCLDTCDPLAPTCAANEACLANPSDDQTFVCVVDASNESGKQHDPCFFANACDPGLVCVDASPIRQCTDSPNCCQPFCDLTAPDPDAVCGDPLVCVPYFPDDPPADHADLGVCAAPP